MRAKDSTIPDSAVERFLTMFAVRESGCWEWQRARQDRGYGWFGLSGHNVSAHRMSWRIFRGAIPRGLCVCHRCDNPSCVNPEHLFLGSNKDNSLDMVAKNRMATGPNNGKYTHPEQTPRGERHGGAKLTNSQVAELRRRYADGESCIALGHTYGIARNSVWRIVTYRNRVHD